VRLTPLAVHPWATRYAQEVPDVAVVRVLLVDDEVAFCRS
jgi:hypothetical protein